MTDLDRQELDAAVAKALGIKHLVEPNEVVIPDDTEGRWKRFSPSTNWQQCGELIEEYNISVNYIITVTEDGDWIANIESIWFGQGATPQEAVCKAIIAAKGEKG